MTILSAVALRDVCSLFRPYSGFLNHFVPARELGFEECGMFLGSIRVALVDSLLQHALLEIGGIHHFMDVSVDTSHDLAARRARQIEAAPCRRVEPRNSGFGDRRKLRSER